MNRPRTRQSTGAVSQLSFIPESLFCPKFLPPNSAAALALDALLKKPLKQIEWLNRVHRWRLAATVKELDSLGLEPQSVLLNCRGWPGPITVRSLPPKSNRTASFMRQRGCHEHN